MAEQTILIMIAVAAVVALLITCPSPVRFWEAVENYAGDRKHARLLIAARQAGRRVAGTRVEVRAEAPAPSTQTSESKERNRLFA